MKTLSLEARLMALGALTVMLSVSPIATAIAAPSDSTARPTRPVRVTTADVEASNKKVAAAYAALVQMWSNEFKHIGTRFAAPRILRYDGNVYSSCGIMRANNAEYCQRDNTIYYDQVFVAGMEKLAGESLHTDGDMAGLGIIAHEMGHAVAMQLGHNSRSSYENESTADCLAGAFALQSQKDGLLEEGDLDEAFFGMSMSGDPTPQPTGNVRYDAMVQRVLARGAHGTKDQRMENFRQGLNGGPSACLADFR